MRFDGKAGLITGAGSGIGRATALGFAARGGAIAVVDLNADNAKKVVKEIESAGGKAIAIAADVTRPEDIDAMVSRAADAFGRLDFLHNNAFGIPATLAGNRAPSPVGRTDDALWDYTINVGLTAVFRAIKRVVPVMRAQGGGAIVNTASISGQRADYGIVAYNAAKAGVINLTRVTAIEYAPYGIRCNCICPGAIDTPLLGAAAAPEMLEQFKRIIPMGRLGRPEEMANAALFLASDLASFITGAALVADGGQTAKTGSPSFLME